MQLQTKKILVVVKAYPNPSRKHVETVCCAGLDLNTGQWIRLYPVPFRLLQDEKKFKKYSVIQVGCHKAADDHRPESYKVDTGTIKVLETIDTSDKWERRKELIMPALAESMCRVCQLGEEKKKSLALVRPVDIGFEWQDAKLEEVGEEKQDSYKQLSFTHVEIKPIEKIPYDFYYTFKCTEDRCLGHRMLIIDWEINQAFRQWRHKYKPESVLLEKIKEKWLQTMCQKADPYFFVGNMHRFPKTFMVLGTFYPPKSY